MLTADSPARDPHMKLNIKKFGFVDFSSFGVKNLRLYLLMTVSYTDIRMAINGAIPSKLAVIPRNKDFIPRQRIISRAVFSIDGLEEEFF